MTYQTNRNISDARAIDDFQDAHSDPRVRAPRDWSGVILGVLVFGPIVLGVVLSAIMRLSY